MSTWKRYSLAVTSCTHPPCGACCTGQAALPVGYYLGVLADDEKEALARIPPALLTELRMMADFFEANNCWPKDGTPCVWYDAVKRQCKHYEHRPDICRTEVVPGDEACLRWRTGCGIDAPKRTFRVVRGKVMRA